MPWDLLIANPAARDLRELSLDDLRRINTAFEVMRSNPHSGDIKFLRGSGARLLRRVGIWRILFEVLQEKRTVVILGVKRRTSTNY